MPRRWSRDELVDHRRRAVDQFIERRAQEGTAEYLRHYQDAQERVRDLFERTGNLRSLSTSTVDQKSGLREAARYLSAPPISDDDLKTLAGLGSKSGPQYLAEMLRVISASLDPLRFPWLFEGPGRQPTPEELDLAQKWTAGLLAAQKAITGRRSAAARRQEQAVENVLLGAPLYLTKVAAKNIPSAREFLEPGEFCRQSTVGTTRADFTIGLRDRLLLIECKSSNSEVNSYKRLNHEVGNKATSWRRSFGQAVVPAALLAGVFKLDNLEAAQRADIAILWEHQLETLIEFVSATR